MKNEIKLTGLENLVNKASLTETNPFNTKFIPVNKIMEHEFNSGRQTAENIDKLKRSIQDAGLLHPLLVYSVGNQYKLIAGHGRLKAIQQLKDYRFNGAVYLADEVPVIIDKTKRDDVDYQVNILRSNAQKDESIEDKLLTVSKAETIYLNYRESGLLTEEDKTNKRKWISEVTGYSESSVRDYLAKLHKKSKSKFATLKPEKAIQVSKKLKKACRNLEKIRETLDELVDEETKDEYFTEFNELKEIVKEYITIIQR